MYAAQIRATVACATARRAVACRVRLAERAAGLCGGAAGTGRRHAFCRAGGKVAVGSPDYVYCRKDRDAARNAAVTRADRKQRDLADYMMAHPDHP